MSEFNALFKSGFFVELTEDESASHELCGENHLNGAGCPNCRKPLLKIFSLDCKDLPVGYAGTLHFLFCWTCNIAQKDFLYKHISDNEIELLEFGQGGIVEDFPYEDYPIAFEGKKAELQEISKEDQDIIHQVNTEQVEEYEINQAHPELIIPRHQIGGEPYLLNEYRGQKCPQCSQDMKFIASFGDSTGGPDGFTNNEYVQTVYQLCESCNTLGAYQMTD